MNTEHFDVLIVGAGLSGIGAAHHLQTRCPDRTYAILEGRSAIGGTWDLFRYPGIRSDSDMYTLGYEFRPWTDPKAIADGASILNYIRDAADDYGIRQHIRFQSKVTHLAWSSADGRWTVDVQQDGAPTPVQLTCNFLFLCCGYYRYDRGYTPDFPGAERFKGRIVHPQQWTDDIVTAGKKVVVIGSGATAVTLVPSIAPTSAHVTLLQRSPTYVMARPGQDAVANTLRNILPDKLAYAMTRWKNVLMGMYFFRMSRKRPQQVKRWMVKQVQDALGPDFDVGKHFTPSYKPWDQRVCVVPGGDLFKVIKSGQASIVTDYIDTFTETGIRLKSGAHLDADVIVTATGLVMELMGGASLAVDGQTVHIADTLNYKGMMFSGVPNLAYSLGYTNASWTLKCDLTTAYACRLLNHMQKEGFSQCVPRNTDPSQVTEPVMQFTSGYVQRALSGLPKQGSHAPWKLNQNYALDLMDLKFGSVADNAMEFSNPARHSHSTI